MINKFLDKHEKTLDKLEKFGDWVATIAVSIIGFTASLAVCCFLFYNFVMLPDITTEHKQPQEQHLTNTK